MKHSKTFFHLTSLPKAWTMLLVMMLSTQVTKVHAADWMHRADKFYMSNYADHVTFNVFVCDLDRSNTYAKKGGIYATSGSEKVWIMDLCYKEEGSDENPFGKVNARYCIGEARAWFTNGYGQAEQKIEFGGKDFLIQKWGDDNHYCTPAIDYYYQASMAGKTWTFYYEYEHNDGGKYTMTLGTATLSSTLGLSHFNTKDYSYERTRPDKIKFTVPALPDDIASKLNEVHIREGKYKVTFIYTKQNNTKVETTTTLDCEKGNKKSYDIDIPEEVGNPKRIDLVVEATDGLKDSRNYYWKDTYTYKTSEVFKVVPIPNSLSAEFRQFDKAADLSWNAYPSSNNTYLECIPYVYRVETDKNGEPLNGSWNQRGKVDNAGKNQAQSYRDNGVQQETFYKYMVLNVPKDWIGNGINESSLSHPDEALLKKLGSVESEVINTKPAVSIYDFKQDTTVTDKVKLMWQYSRIPVTSSTAKFYVLRKTDADGEWAEYGNVTGDAEPKAGTILTFTDSELPNLSTRYQYKIRLSINDGKTIFESDPITAGLLSGSKVNTFEATKGTHESTVRLSWTAKQVGTDNTTYVISRRYVGSESDFIRINTTSGRSEIYTYEDNTVQPGYYYEYKIEAYNENSLQNTLSDAGFCQARGVISGRVTFGTGSAVEDVRLSLRPSNTGDDNTVRGYSLRVDGASTGVAWDADSTAKAKVFGDDKDYSVQMFIRPDKGLSDGAVIGEIPGLGQLAVENSSNGEYKLYCKKDFVCHAKSETCIRGVDNFRAIYMTFENSNRVFGEEIVYCKANAEAIINKWRSEGYVYSRRVSASWTGNSDDLLYLYHKSVEKVITINGDIECKYYDLGINIQPDIYSVLTIQKGQNGVTVSVNDSTSTTMTYVKTVEVGNPFEEHVCTKDDLTLYNGRYVTFEGTLMKSLQTTEWFWHGYEGTMASTDMTRTVDYSMPYDAANKLRFSVGGAHNIAETEAFKGNITEVRVWNHLLTEKEKTNYYDRVLNGRESGLALYWPMDEGLDRYVFDASYANDVPNGRHATVGNNISSSTIIPVDNQLSRYAVTNENGEYIIRGIPFVGSGSTYTIIPTRGIHEFSPQSRNGFIGNGNLTLNSYDFTDISSFPLRGKVTYLNTNIPADSIQFKIDGNIVQTKDGMVVTDANGKYEISVPIGNHLVEAYKDGHRLTSFPLDGSTYEFKRAEIANFVDSTLVNVTGRINGGFSDMNEPVGFGRSVNRLGKATIKLSLGKESQCSFNYITDEHGDGNYGTQNIPVRSASDSIHSTGYRAALKDDNTDTYYVYITTDEKTGEFSALLPPLKYKVESIKFEGGTDYDGLPIFAQNLPMLDATNTIDSKMKVDSVEIDGKTSKYKYVTKMIRQHRANPTITVEQAGTKNGAFGETKIPVRTNANTIDSLVVLTYDDKNYNYMFGHPIFRQNQLYELEIGVSENYKNLDSGEEYQEIPRDAVVSIMNDASILTSVLAGKTTIDGVEYEAGTEWNTPNIYAVPNEKGKITYQFKGGWPNRAEGHLRNMSIGVQVDGRTTMWNAPDSQGDALDMILLGSLPTGSNFMTQGPDKVDYIIRRPPGSTSVASLEKTTITSYGTSTTTIHDKNFGGGAYVSLAPSWESYIGTGNGFISIMEHSHLYVVSNTTNTRVDGHKDTDYESDKDTYTFTEKTSTPNQMIFSETLGDFRPESGDTYIGRSTNLTFSNAYIIDIFQQSDGTYKLDEKTGVAVSESYKTQFSYTQEYIQDYLIPNWKALIKDRLIHVEGNHWDKNNPNLVKVPGEIRYYTSYKEGDSEFGHLNGDRDFWKNKYEERGGWPSYIIINGTDSAVVDEVEFAANQINSWEAKMSQNEADKLEAFGDSKQLIDNYSISGGTSYNQTTKSEHTRSVSVKDDTYYNINDDVKFGLLFNNLGAYGIMTWATKHSEETARDTTNTKATTVAWTLSDSDPRTALSVDVYKSPQGWGPIFRTRGGQTVNPYEGETRTLYYDKDTKLNEATMKVENPQLRIDGNPQQTGVPTGGEARFTLQLKNNSETNSMCTYLLQVVEGSNPNGASLYIDGSVLSAGAAGRKVVLSGNETLTKTLVVKQGDKSIIDYKDIKLILRSEKDRSIFSEEVSLRVQFVPASAHVDLSVDHTVLNQTAKREHGGIVAKMYNLDRQDAGLQGIRLRYRRKGTDTWNLVKQWTTIEELLPQNYEAMPDGSELKDSVIFTEDGVYELQAQTFGKYGQDDVTYESEIIEITQDTHGPKVLGMPSPENGQLTYTNRNDMHIRFNEVLNSNALSKSDNFRIEGDMNNVVFGESPYPDVAVQLNGSRIETDAQYDLSNSNYAFDMWFYRQGDGTILSIGTENNLLSLSTQNDGMLRARVGEEEDVFDTGVKLPKEKWVYMALDYKRKASASEDNRITMLFATANDKNPIYVGQNMPAKDLNGHGKLSVGGDGMVGMVSKLSIWNSDITATELYESRNKRRAAYTPGLVGYWEMNEGHGIVLTDRARSRNMHMESESWYINNENRGAKLDGKAPLRIDISTFNPAKTDNYAIEFWFRGEKPCGMFNQTLLSVVNNFVIGFVGTVQGDQLLLRKIEHSHTEAGTEIETVKEEYVLSSKDYKDGNWHHFALNVRRGTSAIAYIDGEAVKVIPEDNIPGLSGKWMLFGGEELMDVKSGKEYAFSYNHFTGDIDEIRIWSAALDGQIIKDRMYDRLDKSYAGLVGYFPMESIHRNEQGTVTTTFSKENFGETDSRLAIAGELTPSVNAPALLPGSSSMRMDDSQFDFTASNDEIYFSFPDSSLPLMDNNDFTVTVKYIKDEHGNNSETVSWMFHADFAAVDWERPDGSDYYIEINKDWDKDVTFWHGIVNPTGTPQAFEITGLPTWLTAEKTVGVVSSNMTYLKFNVAPTLSVGRHTEYLYITDRLGIQRVMKLVVIVKGDEPKWSVDPNLYESNMTLTGQVYIGDKICEYTDTKIAAFDEMGFCRGVASPAYVSSRDAYYVDMIVYGASATSLSTGERTLNMKMYDASTGKTYPVVFVTMPDGTTGTTFTYAPDANLGSYDSPVVFRSTEDIQQKMTLPAGWSWVSIYVNPTSTAIGDVLPKSKSELKKYLNIKSKTQYATTKSDGSAVLGELTDIVPGNMYKVQLSTSSNFDVYGTVIDVTNTPQDIYPGFNWIGSLSGLVMSPEEAFADLEPEKGDRVKNRSTYAEYNGKGVWEGTLKNIVPGEGYIYQSKASAKKTFHYPRLNSGSASFAKAYLPETTGTTHFTPVDDHKYPDNMNVTAVIEKDGERMTNAEIGAFVNGECRGAVTYNNGYYFLTIMGSASDDINNNIELRAFIEGQEYTIDNTLPFISDASYGSLDEPYALTISTTGIRNYDDTGVGDDDDDWYTLQGYKIGRKPVVPGVYIHHGKKVTVKYPNK